MGEGRLLPVEKAPAQLRNRRGSYARDLYNIYSPLETPALLLIKIA